MSPTLTMRFKVNGDIEPVAAIDSFLNTLRSFRSYFGRLPDQIAVLGHGFEHRNPQIYPLNEQ